jgi:hypothetical protein
LLRRFAGSVRDRAIAVSFAKSSSPIDNSKTCRHAVTIFYLVLRITNEVTTPCRHEESDANNQFQGIERLGDNAGEADDFLRAYAAALGSATRNDFSGLPAASMVRRRSKKVPLCRRSG